MAITAHEDIGVSFRHSVAAVGGRSNLTPRGLDKSYGVEITLVPIKSLRSCHQSLQIMLRGYVMPISVPKAIYGHLSLNEMNPLQISPKVSPKQTHHSTRLTGQSKVT